MCNELIKAIRATEDYSMGEEAGVSIIKAAAMDFANRWFVVEGVKKAWRRIYVVYCSTQNGYVVEVVGGSQMEEADLINYAINARAYEEA